MVTYAALCLTPKILPALTGMTRQEIDRLAIDFAAARDRRAETLADLPFEWPAAERARLGTKEAVFDAFPEVKVVIDGKEPPFQCPQGWDEQKPFYSGKKRRHTVKNQALCTPQGRIGGGGATVSDSSHDLTMMGEDGVFDRLGEGEGAMADKAYTGAGNDRPGVPLVVSKKATRGHPLTEEQKAANRKISGCRVVIEHVMGQLNRFQALKQVFRSAFVRHTRAIRVVAALVGRRIAAVPLKALAAT